MKKIILICLVVGLIGVFGAFAQYKPVWTTNGNLVMTDEASSSNFFVLSCANDSQIIFWTNGQYLEARKVAADGSIEWETEVYYSLGVQQDVHACVASDNNIIVVWSEIYQTKYNIYAKKINLSNGNTIWASLDMTPSGTYEEPKVCADSNNGGYIAYRSEGATDDIYVGKISSVGTKEWGSNLLVVAGYLQSYGHKIISAENDMAWICFDVFAGKDPSLNSIRAVKVNSSRQLLMTKEAGTGTDFDAVQVGDYLAVSYARVGDIYAQYLTEAGTKEWSPLPVCNAIGVQEKPKMVTDGSGNLFIGWLDGRANADYRDIYMQKVNTGAGSVQWVGDGIPVSTAEGDKAFQITESKGDVSKAAYPMGYSSGKVFITWHDYRSDLVVKHDTYYSPASNADIYMQAVDTSNGARLSNDFPVCSVINAQILPELGASTPLVGWYDIRDGINIRLRYQKIINDPTQITGITTLPAGQGMVINGQGFAPDPTNIQNPNFTLGSSYNNVTIDNSTAEIISWFANAITLVASHDALAPGIHTFEVTAYGDAGLYTLSVAQPIGSIAFENEKFGGDPYSAGGYVTANPTFEVEITSEDTSQNRLNINTVTIEVNGAATDVTNDFSSDILLTSLPLPQRVSEVAYTVKVIAVNEIGEEGSEAYTVKVAGEEENVIIEYLIPSETVIDSQRAKAAATGDITLAFNSSKAATISIIIYTPAGRPIKLVREVSAGYNEIPLDRQLFYESNGIHIISIYDKNNRLLQKTWITVRL